MGMGVFLFFSTLVFASDFDDLPDCATAGLGDGACIERAQQLHPTQFALGLRRVTVKHHHIQSLSRADRQAYLARNPVPVVLGPRCQLYLTDHHHLARAVLEAGHSKVVLTLLHDWSHLSVDDFWDRMERAGLVYLLDEAGQGPQDPRTLPASVLALVDDPYRSLAGFARERGCFQKSPIPYAEFQWAEHFRPRIDVGTTNADFKAAVQAALSICHDPAAGHLPGFIP